MREFRSTALEALRQIIIADAKRADREICEECWSVKATCACTRQERPKAP